MPGPLPAHWWLKPSAGFSAGLLVGRAGSWSLVTGLGEPRAVVGLLAGLGETQFLGLVAGDGLLTAECGVWGVSKLVLPC